MIELGVATLSKPIEMKQGVLPAGYSGKVTHAYRDGRAVIIVIQPFATRQVLWLK